MRAAPIVSIVLVLFGAGPREAFPQALFVQGGFAPEVRRFSAERGEEVLDGTAGTVTLAVAGFLSPRWTAGLEVDAGASSTASRTVTVTLGGRPTAVTTTYTVRRRGVSALAGFHTNPQRRVRLGLYGGLSFSSVHREVASDAPPIVLSQRAPPSVFVDRSASPVAGADVAVALTPYLSVVGSVRAQGLTLAGDVQGIVVRPGAAVRVVF